MIVRRPLETARCYFVFVPPIQSWFVLFCFFFFYLVDWLATIPFEYVSLFSLHLS